VTLACHSNRRSLARPIVTSADTDHNECDHPESVMTTPDSNTARALVNEMRRSSTLTNEENDSHKPSISSNLLADLFRRREEEEEEEEEGSSLELAELTQNILANGPSLVDRG